MKIENRRQTAQTTPACWQREAPCPCLRIETSQRESHLFAYQHLVTASLHQSDETETLRLTFSLHDVEIKGRNLRTLLLALQDFAVKWIRAMPERYHGLESGENGIVSSIRINEANSSV
jgi:hypothetical protein